MHNHAALNMAWSNVAISRAYMAPLTSLLSLKAEKLWMKAERSRARLFSGIPKKLLFSGSCEWEESIRSGFEHLPHQLEFGPITDESYQRYDIVVPLTLTAIEDARRHSDPRRQALPLPSHDSVVLCDDKYEFNLALMKTGFGRYIPKMTKGSSLPYPYILKKRTGTWGRDVYMIRNGEDEERYREEIGSDEYFLQDMIAGTTEFATHILFVAGRVIKALNIKYEFSSDLPIKGKDDFNLRVLHRCEYLDLFSSVLRVINFEGLCCVNYKVWNGRPYLLEINPRFGGSLAPYFFSFVKHLRA